MDKRHLLKWVSCVLVLVAISLVFSGCNGSGGSSSSTGGSESQGSESQPVEPVDPEDGATEDMKRVGKENYGFWDVPDSWVSFVDVDAAPEDEAIQYSDILGANIITVRYFDDMDITPEQLLIRQAAYMESIGGVDVEGATVQLNGIPSLQVYGGFPDDATIMVTWAFESDGGVLHMISAEGPMATILETVGYLESSYALEE